MALGRLALVTLDCPDPVALARFYQSILGGEVNGHDVQTMSIWTER